MGKDEKSAGGIGESEREVTLRSRVRSGGEREEAELWEIGFYI